MAERKGINLSARGSAARAESGGQKKKKPPRTEPAKEASARSRNNLDMGLGDDPEDDDDDILDDVGQDSGGKSKLLLPIVGVIVVVVVIAGFLIFGGGRRNKNPGNTSNPGSSSGQSQVQTPVQTNPSGSGNTSPAGTGTPAGMGTQDFTGNTNNNAGNVLTNPDEYVEDIYGLTTRVDYNVKRISSVADFVSYEKHRGTWGGGLELYWLDATYKNQKYVVQVPFQYYKELDDVGIIPVKMEVLTIEGSAEGEELTVISYMCLDEKVLSDILKNQAKAK